MEKLLAIIGSMYDAALDPSLWTSVLVEIGTYLKAAQVAVVLENVADPGASLAYQSFSAPEWVALYFRDYMLINPMRLATVASVGDGDVILTSDFMSVQEYQRTPFAREFLGARGLIDNAVAVLERTASSILVLSAQRNAEQGFADDLVRQKLGWLAPHAQRAIKIGELMDRKTVEVSSLASTLDGLNAAVFLLDQSGTVLHTNALAQRMIADEDVTRKTPGRLVFCDQAAARAMSNALRLAAGGDGSLGAAGRAIAVHGRSGTHYVATVLPLTAGRRRPIASSYRAVAAVCVKEAAFELPPAVSTLASLYGLTRREMSILVGVCELGGAPDVATATGLSTETVKSHLKSIYVKTGATRQADLVKLVAGIGSAFGVNGAAT